MSLCSLFPYLCDAFFVKQEIIEKMKRIPSDAELMKIALSDLNNESTSLEDKHRALQELLELVEPIDNANGTCLTQFFCTFMYNHLDYSFTHVFNCVCSVYFFLKFLTWCCEFERLRLVFT